MTTQQPAQASDVRTLAEQFIQHGIYLRDWSQRTASTYRFSFRELPSQLTKASLNAAVLAMRERGLSAGGINLRIRSINSFLTWLHEEGHVSERLRLKLLKNPPRPIKTINAQDIRLLMAFKPSGRIQIRTWTLAVLLLDCGLRIDEALGLDRASVDLDALMLRVLGKGSRERLVPISLELRKHLFRFLKRTSGRYVFQAFDGSRLSRHNAYRDLQKLCARAGIKTHVHPHGFRHAFAAHSTRNGLDVFRLSRILGHSSITTTQIYLRSLGIEHLQDGHAKCSPISGTAQR